MAFTGCLLTGALPGSVLTGIHFFLPWSEAGSAIFLLGHTEELTCPETRSR